MAKHRIAVIPGDGIGPEIIREGIKELKAVEKKLDNLSFEFEYFPWGCEYYLKMGRMLAKDGLEKLKNFATIYLGAIGDPRVPDHISLRDLLLEEILILMASRCLNPFMVLLPSGLVGILLTQ